MCIFLCVYCTSFCLNVLYAFSVLSSAFQCESLCLMHHLSCFFAFSHLHKFWFDKFYFFTQNFILNDTETFLNFAFFLLPFTIFLPIYLHFTIDCSDGQYLLYQYTIPMLFCYVSQYWYWWFCMDYWISVKIKLWNLSFYVMNILILLFKFLRQHTAGE